MTSARIRLIRYVLVLTRNSPDLSFTRE